jgi:KaiC/GvpD/RAD55 family RecA-like ATPase
MEGQNNQFLPRSAKVPILSELLGEVPFGRAILVLYDPDSQSTALFVNISSEYLRAGGDVNYFASSEPVAELRQRFERLGLNIREYEAKDSVVLFDAYSAQSGAKTDERYQSESANLNELSIAMGQSAPQWPAGSLIVWESLSQIAFNQENVFAKFSRKAIGIWRSQGTIMLSGFATDLHPQSFYQELKMISDAVVEIKLVEYESEIINTIRVRSFKGHNVDTRARRIVFDDKMKATLELLKR